METFKFREPEPVKVEFGGRVWSLILNMYSLRMADRKMKEICPNEDRSIYAIINDEIKNIIPILRVISEDKAKVDANTFKMNLDLVAVLLWAAMLEDEPTITLDGAEKLIRDPLLGQIAVAILIYRMFFENKQSSEPEVSEIRPLEPSNRIDFGPSRALNSE